eukprot:TRINITY_DN14761_c0_g1_i1.p3 TRINITY_DN14761_c0_g1~~TRINITY_DN14761_c0_g1_i1.p3  ORF type:complete len:154 (-),score=26.19 TRINITY_DN14761_c0_g1_i1:148-588(-)
MHVYNSNTTQLHKESGIDSKIRFQNVNNFSTDCETQNDTMHAYNLKEVQFGSLKKVAVEVDGVHHFTRNSPRRALGDSVLRNRMLAQRGWNVVIVPFYLWNDFDRDQRQEFLTRIIAYATRDTNDEDGYNQENVEFQDLVFKAFDG